jgi:glycosyltransferase involved in cell wall biosynthesis
MSDPVLSIVTCTYNSETYLPLSLQSVEQQTYPHIEHIINDSFSTDRTRAILDAYIKRNQARYPIKVIHTPAEGVARALNEATKEASGDLIHYLHSDVYYYARNSVWKAVSHFKRNPDLVWLTGKLLVSMNGYQVLLPNTWFLKMDPEKALTITNFISHENTFMRRQMVQFYDGFNEDQNYVVEYRLWLHMIRDYKPLVVDDPFTVFIIHKGSTSTGSPWKLLAAFKRAYNTLRKEQVFPMVGYVGDHALYHRYRQLEAWSDGVAERFSVRR